MAVVRSYTDKKGIISFQAIVRKKGHKPLSKMFSKEADAIKWAKGVEVDMERQVFIDVKEATITTLTDALDRYEEIAKKNKGYSMEKYRIDVWRRHDLAKRSIVSLKSKDFDEYKDQRRAEGMSDATIRNDLAIIAAIFKHFDYGMSSPTIKTVKTLATAKKRSRRLGELEQEYLLAELDNTNCSDPKRTNKWIPLVTRFAIETAARLSEIVGKDKTADEAAVPGLLWENVQMQKSICKLIDTKNGESRFVPLSPAAIACLTQAQELSPEKRGPVFPTTNSAIKQSWQRAKKRAQSLYKARGGTDPDFLVDFRFHDNRHEAASRWARDFDQTKLKMITGHKDTRSLDRYINANEEDVAMIAAKMAEVQNTKAS